MFKNKLKKMLSYEKCTFGTFAAINSPDAIKLIAMAGLDFVIIDFTNEHCKTEEEVIEKSRDADGVMTVFRPLNRTVVGTLTKCKVFVRYGVGYDVIDVPAAAGKSRIRWNGW
jgi:Phosphoglycerate dehydrogenase and related dehydrogenases